MNLGELKARLDQNAPHVGRSEPNGPSRDDGVRQSTDQHQNEVTLSNSEQSRRFIGLKIFSSALSQSLVLDERRPSLPVRKPEQDNKSLFDFEEVAKNVLRFVGGAIKHAQAKGMEDEKLAEMFEQARSGVLKGVQMAEKDLAGFMNEELSSGIKKSRELIEEGINNLEKEIFGTEDKDSDEQQVALRYSDSVSYSRQDSSELTIRTQDGDEVRISFDSLRQFELNRSLTLARQSEQAAKEDRKDAQSKNSDTDEEQSRQEKSEDKLLLKAEQQVLFYEKNGFGFSVEGELDEDELRAIGDLVDKTADLADEFFNGDVESAFEQALKLGFDETEITSYALQMSRQEQFKVTQTYESVLLGDEKFKEMEGYVKPVSHYLDRMLEVVEQSKQELYDNSTYDNIITGLVNKMLKVDTPDLLDAITRFHNFNQRLQDNLPLTQPVEPKDKAQDA